MNNLPKEKKEKSKLQKGLELAGEASQSYWISDVDNFLKNANEEIINKYLSEAAKDSYGLHGKLAEHWHAKTFNLKAKIEGKPYVAEVLESNRPNSVDVVIKNQQTGEILKRYQLKYGKDAYHTTKYLEEGNYRGQKPLVPSDQLDKVTEKRIQSGKSVPTDRLEYDGVSSEPLSREDAEKLKEKIRKRNQIYNWEENVTYKEAFIRVGQDSVKVAAFALLLRGGIRLGKTLIDTIRGKNVDLWAEFEKFVKDDLKGAVEAAAKTIVTGAITVAARKGLIKILKNTPVGKIAAIVEGAWRVGKQAIKWLKGEITFGEFVKTSVKEVAGVFGGITGAAYGFSIGATIGSVVPVVGTFVGGMIGGIIGGIIGEETAKTLVEKVQTAVKKVKDTAKEIWNTVKQGVFGTIISIFG